MNRDEAKAMSDIDQARSILVDNYPATLYAYYSQLIKEGFTKKQAFVLTKDMQIVMMGNNG